MRACSASSLKFYNSPDSNRGALGSFCTTFCVEKTNLSALLIIQLRQLIMMPNANIYNNQMNADSNINQDSFSSAAPSWHKVYQQTQAILTKNYYNTTAHKAKIIAEFILPLIISAIYAVAEQICPGSALASSAPRCQNAVAGIVLNMLLVIYVGLIGTSALRQLVSLFIGERNDQSRQYQMIMGVSYKTHTLANLLYMMLYLSVTILPFYLTLNYYHLHLPYILYFAAFVLSSSFLTLALTAFFRDQKIALELIGLFYSLTAFLPFLYDRTTTTPLNYLISIIPNSSFAIALIHKDFTISLLSLSLVKGYVFLFLFMEFRQITLDKIRKCCRLIRQYATSFSPRNTVLMEEFQLNEIVNPNLRLAEPTPRAIIQTHALSKQYCLNNRQLFALNRLSIKIYQSQIFGLLGRNGAGKTTLVDILTKVTRASSGSVEMASINGIGICYQHQILYQNLTVSQHLSLYSKLKILEEGQHGIADVVRMLKMQGEVDKKVKDLSGGNKRKLSIGIAVLNKPELLIFDEPTSGLDPLSRTYIWDVLLELKRRNSTIILTTHHLDEAERLSDTICVIQRGASIVQNTPSFIKQKYGKGFHLKIWRRGGFQPQDKLISQHQNQSVLSFDRCRALLDELNLKSVQIECSKISLDMVIKADDKGQQEDFEGRFQKWLERLEKESDIDFKFHSNTLEESFIAILKEEDSNSGESWSQQAQLKGSGGSVVREGLVKWLYQIVSVFLKNYYFRKSTLMQSLTLYNINIIIVVIYYAFNRILSQNGLKEQPSQAESSPATSSSMILVQGYIAMATAFITAPVYETEQKITSVLNARGLSRSSYWLGNFAFDYTVFMLNLVVMKYVAAGESVDEVGVVELSWMGAAMIVYAYCVSNLFSKLKTANAWFSVINMCFGFIIMPMIILGGSNQFLRRLSIIKYVYPFYSLTLKSISSNRALNVITNIEPHNQYTVVISLLAYSILLLLIEFHPFQRITHPNNHPLQSYNHQIQFQNVSKIFGKTKALQNINYAIGQQRVALLGHNGAGKSTTFSLLTLQDSPTEGFVYISRRLGKSYERVLASAGVCYQQDALWEQMRVGEILNVLKWMVPIEGGAQEANWLCESLQLQETSLFKRFRSLSGGNKRKLCLLVALFGNPELRLLDECSTGLDPSSRAAMVQTIKHPKKGCTLFTTHSMSQAQRVCSKAIIMSQGRVLQFQQIDKLVDKHFDCRWIDVVLMAQEAKESLLQIAVCQLQAATIIAHLSIGRHFRLQVSKQVRQSKVLQWIRHGKEKGLIASYSWVEPLLEDVYIKLTREHMDNILGQ